MGTISPGGCAENADQVTHADTVYEPLKAYAQPCFSPHDCCPVDSSYERKTLRLLQEWQKMARREFGQDFTIVKPLFDENACRPDFVLELVDGRKIVIETMGYQQDAQYEASKLITHQLMQQHFGIVLQHDMRRRGLRFEAPAKTKLLQDLKTAIRDRIQPPYP